MIQVFSCSEPGGHIRNEDAFAVQPHPLDPNCHLCVVADGQGGRAGGAQAAQLACRKCVELAECVTPVQLLVPGAWSRILHTVDETVRDHPEAGYTTLVAMCTSSSLVCGASSGDSAAVVILPTQPPHILTAHQHKNPPVGSGDAVFAGFACKLTSPWTVLAMTDGVWKYAGWDQVLKIAAEKHGDALMAAIKDRARLLGTGALQDDFTLVALHDAPG